MRVARRARGLSAEGRLSAYILMALPIGLFLYMLTTNREYIALLWSGPIGWAMLAGGSLAMVAGYFWMNSVVKVEV